MHTAPLRSSASRSILIAVIPAALIAVACDDGDQQADAPELDASATAAETDPSDGIDMRRPSSGAADAREHAREAGAALEAWDGARPSQDASAPANRDGATRAAQIPGAPSNDAGSTDAGPSDDALPPTPMPACRGAFEQCIDEHAIALWSLDLTSLTSLTDLALDIVTNLSLSPVTANAIEPCLAAAEGCGLFAGQGAGAACLEAFAECSNADPILLGTCIGQAETCGLFADGSSACFDRFLECNVDVFGIPDCLVEARACGLKPLIPPLPF